jgi:hypothetical protein
MGRVVGKWQCLLDHACALRLQARRKTKDRCAIRLVDLGDWGVSDDRDTRFEMDRAGAGESGPTLSATS